MKIPVPPEKWKLFERWPRKDRPPFPEVAAVQFFKLVAWSTATAGIYLLQRRSGVVALKAIPYVLWLLIVWDISAKLGFEPEIERTDNTLHLILPRTYWVKLAAIGIFSGLVAWAVVFWLAPLIARHGLASF